MNEWDQQVERQVEADGVRMASGQHIGVALPDPDNCGCWISRRGNLIWRCDQHFGCDEADFWAKRDENEQGCWYDGQGQCTVHDHADNDLPEEDPWVDRRDDDR